MNVLEDDIYYVGLLMIYDICITYAHYVVKYFQGGLEACTSTGTARYQVLCTTSPI